MAITVQGHRGARGTFPENTLPAFHHAIELGVKAVELDIVVARDHALMVAHDLLLNPAIQRWKDGRTVDSTQTVYSLGAGQLRELDCGAIKNPRFPYQRTVPGAVMPTLDELFAYVNEMSHPNATAVYFNIELKSLPAGDGRLHPKPREYAKLLVAAVKRSGWRDRVCVQSFDHRLLAEVRKLDRALHLSALFSENAVDYVAVAKKLGVQMVSVHKDWVTRADVRALHEAKRKVFVWTANEQRDWERLASLKVDSIITDYPAELLEFLRTKQRQR